MGSTSSPKTDDETQRSRRSQQAKMRARVGGVGFSHRYYLTEKPFQKSCTQANCYNIRGVADRDDISNSYPSLRDVQQRNNI